MIGDFVLTEGRQPRKGNSNIQLLQALAGRIGNASQVQLGCDDDDCVRVKRELYFRTKLWHTIVDQLVTAGIGISSRVGVAGHRDVRAIFIYFSSDIFHSLVSY